MHEALVLDNCPYCGWQLPTSFEVVEFLAVTLGQQKFPWEAEYYRVEDEDETYYVYIKVAKEEDLLCPEDCEMYCKTLHDEEGDIIRRGE